MTKAKKISKVMCHSERSEESHTPTFTIEPFLFEEN
jgi:hypothetical protein